MSFSVFKMLDRFSQPVQLKMGGKETNKTYVGAICTIVYYCLLVTSISKIYHDLYDKTKPKIDQNTKESLDYPKIDLFENRLAPAFIFTDNNGEAILPNEIYKYFTFKMYQRTSLVNRRYEWSSYDHHIDTQIPVIPCKKLRRDVFEKLYGYYNIDMRILERLIETGICVNPPKDKWFVEGKATDLNLTHISFQVSPCVSNKSDCVTDTQLAGSSLSIIEPKNGIDYSSISNPLSIIPHTSNTFLLSPNLTLRLEASIIMNKIRDVSGYFRDEVIKVQYADIDSQRDGVSFRDVTGINCTSKNTGQSVCPPYLTYAYKSSGTTVEVERRYDGIFESMALLGGIERIISYLIGLCYWLLMSTYSGLVSNEEYIVDVMYDTSDDGVMKTYMGELGIRRSEEKKKKREIIETYRNNIERCLDVTNIVRELSRVRMMFDIILPHYTLLNENVAILCTQKYDDDEKKKVESERMEMVAREYMGELSSSVEKERISERENMQMEGRMRYANQGEDKLRRNGIVKVVNENFKLLIDDKVSQYKKCFEEKISKDNNSKEIEFSYVKPSILPSIVSFPRPNLQRIDPVQPDSKVEDVHVWPDAPEIHIH